jgi:hypothetical protein
MAVISEEEKGTALLLAIRKGEDAKYDDAL